MIGIFDSGSGGLTVLRHVQTRLPKADIIYFADLHNMPYGNKKRKELGVLTENAINFLIAKGANHIISACNSVSASLVESLVAPLNSGGVDVIEMVKPTVQALYKKKGRLVIVSTQATADSKIYHDGFNAVGMPVAVFPIPYLAQSIEYGEPLENVRRHIDSVMPSIAGCNPDTLVLGCTQFPLVQQVFERMLRDHGIDAQIYDPAEAVADVAAQSFEGNEHGKTRFFTSKQVLSFEQRVQKLYPESDISYVSNELA